MPVTKPSKNRRPSVGFWIAFTVAVVAAAAGLANLLASDNVSDGWHPFARAGFVVLGVVVLVAILQAIWTWRPVRSLRAVIRGVRDKRKRGRAGGRRANSWSGGPYACGQPNLMQVCIDLSWPSTQIPRKSDGISPNLKALPTVRCEIRDRSDTRFPALYSATVRPQTRGCTGVTAMTQFPSDFIGNDSDPPGPGIYYACWMIDGKCVLRRKVRVDEHMKQVTGRWARLTNWYQTHEKRGSSLPS